MSRIEDSLVQAEVEDSILNAPIVATLTHEGNFVRPEEAQSDAEHGESVFDDPMDYFSEAIYAQDHMAEKLGDQGLRELLAKEEQQEAPEIERAKFSKEELAVLSPEERILRQLADEDQQQAQAQPLTPEQSQEVVANLNSTIEELGLNQDAQQFASNFAAVTGNNNVNPGVLANTFSVSTIAAYDGLIHAAGDLSKVPPPSAEWATGCSNAVAQILDVNPQAMADPVRVGNLVHYSLANLIRTHAETGSTNPQELNDKDVCAWYMREIQKAITGVDEPVDKERAFAFVNMLTAPVLARLSRIRAEQERLRDAESRQGQGGRTSTGRGRGQGRVPKRFQSGLKGSPVPTMQTHTDIFSREVLRGATTQNL